MPLKTVEDLVLTMLREVPLGDEVSSTGLIISSLRSLEEAIERALQDLQFSGKVTKRWRSETQSLVYTFVPERNPKDDNTNSRDTTCNRNDNTGNDDDDNDDPFRRVNQLTPCSE